MTEKRTFILGDQWLYYKVYCGARTADTILTGTLKPLTERLLRKKHITQWFFIRYNDPEFHIRLRLYLKDTRHIGRVIRELHKALNENVEDDVIHNIQAATYRREIERYGANTTALSETLFYHESVMLLSAIQRIADEKLYFLFVLKAIDHLLDDFSHTIEEKLHLVTVNCDAFKREFQADRNLNKQLDKKYRDLNKMLTAFLNAYHTHEAYLVLERLITEKSRKTDATVRKILEYKDDNRLDVAWDSLISSYIHMLVNRAFRSRQRFYELVCYEFLKRYYTRLKIYGI